MARPIDPALRAARRTQIIDAGLTAFAQFGPTATTAQVCALAGIASGTFFHHFPTKDSLLVAILELGETETRLFFNAYEADAPPLKIISDYVDHCVRDVTDPRAAGFIRAVSAMAHREIIAQTLHAQERFVQEALALVVSRAQLVHAVRDDISAERLAAWILLIIDGFTGAVASGSIVAGEEVMLLHEQIRKLLGRQD